jgi:vacuolar-type H+-ATPase subunit D/Vma8
MKEKTEELTTEQRDIARQARNAYQRARKEAQRRTYERYWYNRALREAQAKEEAADESKAENATEANG